MNYITDSDLTYEIILSKGKGFRTKELERYLYLVGVNFMHKKRNNYKAEGDYYDCLQSGLLFLLLNWHKFNEQKYYKSLPYITEIFKRGMAFEFNRLQGKKQNFDVMFVSIDEMKERYYDYGYNN